MARRESDTIASFISSSAAVGGSSKRSFTYSFCLFRHVSATSLRRKLLETLTCGTSCSSAASSSRKKHKPTTPTPGPLSPGRRGSDRLWDLLKAEEEEDEEWSGLGSQEEEGKGRKMEEMKAAVARLAGKGSVEAAEEVRRLAKDDREARAAMAMMGAIPALVRMFERDGSGDVDEKVRISALYALLNLSIGNDVNKAAIVEAGAIHGMLHHLSSTTTSRFINSAIIANFLSLSALDANKPIIGISGAIPFLTKSFTEPTSPQSKHDSLRALYNLSLHPPNAPHLLDSGALPFIISSISADTDLASRGLSILSNLVSSPAARCALTREPEALPILIDVLNWVDEPECQEKAAYVLMVFAYKGGNAERVVMVEAGIVSACLELTLLGSGLAQKRASRILEFLTVDKGKQVSESFASTPTMTMVGVEDESKGGGNVCDEQVALKQLVQQSLQSNMRRIARRANLAQELTPADHLRALTATPTSRSLPF